MHKQHKFCIVIMDQTNTLKFLENLIAALVKDREYILIVHFAITKKRTFYTEIKNNAETASAKCSEHSACKT